MISSSSRSGGRPDSTSAQMTIQQIALSELHGRQIDRDLDVDGQLAASVQAVCKTHSPDRRDQAGLLGERNELSGRIMPGGMPPSHQGLDAAGPRVLRVDDRLVVHLELVAANGAAQIVLHLVPRDRCQAHLRSKKR